MSPSTCTDPQIEEQLLDLAQFARRRSLPNPVRLSAEQSWHLEGCSSCRVSLERARRLVATHQSLQPSDAEVSAARGRFAQRNLQRFARARWARLLPRAITVGLLLGLVAGAAAQIAARRWAASKDVSRVPPRAAHGGGAARQAPAIAPLSEPNAEPRVQKGGRPGTANAASPGTLRDTPSARVHGNRRLRLPIRTRVAAEPAAPPDPAAGAVDPAAGVGSGATWEPVAAALRAGDAAAAESALDRLATLNDARTRDAARLARAQLWLSRGQAAPARDELVDLAATGATPTIRARARDALETRP